MGKSASFGRLVRGSAPRVISGALALVLSGAPAFAQVPPAPANVLINGGYESSVPPNCGNNYPWSIVPWQMVSGSQTNVVAVDGGMACNYGTSGPAVDAEGAPAGTRQHYLDLLATGTVYQSFTVPACAGMAPTPRKAVFSGAFSSRDGSTAGSGRIELRAGDGVAGTVLASSATTAGSLTHLAWTQIGGTVDLTPGDTISYVVSMTNPTNFDNAVVRFDACPVLAAAPVPADAPWALLLAMAGVGWLMRRRLQRG